MRHGSDGQYYIYDIGNNALLAAYSWVRSGPIGRLPASATFSATTRMMLLRNSNSGACYVYDVENNNITGSASLGNVGSIGRSWVSAISAASAKPT